MPSFESIPTDAVIDVETLYHMLDEGQDLYILDIRGWRAYFASFIDGSINIPVGQQLEIRIEEIPRDRTVAIVDQDNGRVAQARQALVDQGYDEALLKVVDGGMNAWEAAGYPTQSQVSARC